MKLSISKLNILSLLLVMGFSVTIIVNAEEGNNSNYSSLSDIGNKSDKYSDSLRNNEALHTQTAEGKFVGDEDEASDDKYMDTVIYNDIHKKMSNQYTYKSLQGGQTLTKEQSINIATPMTDKIQAMAILETKYQTDQMQAAKDAKAKVSEIPTYFVGGYCTVNTPVKIVRSSEFTTLNCMLDFGSGEYRDATVFVGVYPNYKKEVLSMLPIYASFNNQKKASFDGVVFAHDKSSLNTADHVENFKIRELVAEYGLAINDIAYRYSLDFMRVLQESRKTTNVEYVTVPDANSVAGSTVVPIVTDQTRPPKIEEYFALAGVELVSQLVSIGAKNLLEDTEPLFRIYKDKRVWVEGVITFDDKGLAKKYGRIATEEKDNNQKDNNMWVQDRKNIVSKYDTNKASALDFQRDNLNSSSSGTTIIQPSNISPAIQR